MEQQLKAVEAAFHTVSDVGRFRLIAELARGGMGVVYLALVGGPGGFNKLFVLKELKAHLAEDGELVALFLEEARISAKLSHPNVVQTIEVGSDGPRHYIAMEFLDGQALNRILSRAQRSGRTLPLRDHLHILSSMLEGLDYVHDLADFDGKPLGLVHRDVSPHNLFVGYDGQVKLLDFGIAKVLDSSHQTSTGMLKGKIKYMSPEQASGSPVDRRSDVFAAGVMLWEAVAGTRMWGTEFTDLYILRALTTGSIPNVRASQADVDEPLARIIDQATAFDRQHRYVSAAALQQDLDSYLRSLRPDRYDARATGRFVADAFSDERERIKGVIETQLRLLRETNDYARIELPRLSPSSGVGGTPSAIAVYADASQSMARPASGRTSSGATLASSPSPSERSRSWRLARLLPAVVIVAVCSSVVTYALRFASRAQPTSASTAPPSAVGPRSVEPLPPSSQPIRVKITAVPTTASLSIDGSTPRPGPFDGNFPRDAALHTIVVVASGFATKTLEFSADSDRTYELILEPERSAPEPTRPEHRAARAAQLAPPSAAASVAAPSPVPAAVVTPAASATERNRQQIDTKDPYAK